MPETLGSLLLLGLLVLTGAVLYSAGGHGGGTAYIAAMALVGVVPEVLRPTALVMNVGVSTIGSLRFGRVGAIPWGLLFPLLAGSIPAAFLGGTIKLPYRAYLALLGVLLLFAAWRLWRPAPAIVAETLQKPSNPLLFAIGASLGFLSGLTGIGGGIFLTPILLLSGWADPRRTSGAAAVFILVNSLSGLAAQTRTLPGLPAMSFVLVVVAMVGGLVGSWLGARRFESATLRRVHAVVVLVSGARLLWEGVSRWMEGRA